MKWLPSILRSRKHLILLLLIIVSVFDPTHEPALAALVETNEQVSQCIQILSDWESLIDQLNTMALHDVQMDQPAFFSSAHHKLSITSIFIALNSLLLKVMSFKPFTILAIIAWFISHYHPVYKIIGMKFLVLGLFLNPGFSLLTIGIHQLDHWAELYGKHDFTELMTQVDHDISEKSAFLKSSEIHSEAALQKKVALTRKSVAYGVTKIRQHINDHLVRMGFICFLLPVGFLWLIYKVARRLLLKP